jgi:hypothetical protein
MAREARGYRPGIGESSIEGVPLAAASDLELQLVIVTIDTIV